MTTIRIGTAGWTIPPVYGENFTASGSHLERYAGGFNAVEINSTFYKLPRPATIRRWIGMVSPQLRFSVKMPRRITHEQRLVNVIRNLEYFCKLITEFEDRLGPVLVQLPPTLEYSEQTADAIAYFREKHAGTIVLEPRHPTWTAPDVDYFLRSHMIGRVAADPARSAKLAEPGGSLSLAYFRLHGSPRMYWSAYSIEALEHWADHVLGLAADGSEVWVVFDNTARGAATGDALTLMNEIIPNARSRKAQHGVH